MKLKRSSASLNNPACVARGNSRRVGHARWPAAFASSARECGFTLLESLVALGLFAIVGGIVASGLVMQSNTYMTDMTRVTVQQNLRGALDILAMNIRQAGEGLDTNFPALILNGGTTLKTRRKMVHEVLTLCLPVEAGVGTLYVSDVTSSAVACTPANVVPSMAVWSNYRVLAGGATRLFVYNRGSKEGEFLDYTGDGVVTTGALTGDHYLTVNPVQHDYPISTTNIYILEEYSFTLDPDSKTLRVSLDGVSDEPRDVAYHVDDFHSSIRLKNTVEITDLDYTNSTTWKDIRSVHVSLSGSESWKGKTYSRSLEADYFPRNVLSQ